MQQPEHASAAQRRPLAPSPLLIAPRRAAARPAQERRPPRRQTDPVPVPWPLTGSVAEQAAACGIRCDAAVEHEAAEYLGVPDLQLPLPAGEYAAFAASWKQATAGSRAASSAVQLVVFLFVRAVVDTSSSAVAPALLAQGLTACATRLHVGLLLGGQLYAHGRAVSPGWPKKQSDAVDQDLITAPDPERERVVTICFHAAIAAWSVATDPRRLPPTKRRLLHGMRGVARKYLAHHHPEPIPLLVAARADLEAAGDLGAESDRSPEHFDVLAQVLIRLHEHGAAPDGLDEARCVIREAWSHHHDSPELLVDLGDVLLRSAQRATTPGDSDTTDGGESPRLRLLAVRSALQAAALLFDRARRRSDGALLDIVRAHRGRALGRLAGAQRALGLPFIHLLDEAVEQLRICAEPNAPYHGTGLTGALLARAQHHHRTKDFDHAENDVREALTYIEAYDDAAEPAHRLALIALDVELELRRAIDAGDVPVTRRRLRQLLDLPPEVNRVATPLVYAARLLLTEATVVGLPPDERRLIDEVVAELLAQDRPDVAAHHIRYVNWHAATLLGVLRQRGGDDLDERIYRLLERALTADRDAPSPVLVMHTGRAAAALARRYIAARSAEDDAAAMLDRALGHLGPLATQLGLDAQLVETSGTITAIDRLLDDPGQPNSPIDPDALGEDLLVDLQEAEGTGEIREQAAADVVQRLDRAALASRIAEIHLRAAQYGNGIARCMDALRWFELAHRLGNHTAELLGLTGDALHQLNRYAGTGSHRRRVLRAKAAARAMGSVGRENPSLCASVLLKLWQEGGSPTDHRDACASAMAAHAADPLWPWPLLQLADLAAAPAATRAHLGDEGTPPEIWEAVHAGRADELRRRAVELAVRSEEFVQSKLNRSSRTFTAVLDDPHDLLSSTLVLKPTRRADAERERDATLAFAAELRARAAPPWMTVPIPIAIVPWQGDRSDVVYAMRRARGIPLSERLGRLVLRGRPHDGRRDVERALALLARFHCWRRSDAARPASLSDRVTQLAKVAHRLRIDGSTWEVAFRAALGNGLASVPYKDAHAGNWLVASNGSMVALDMESSTTRPQMFELPRLIEDYPVLAITDAGWHDRVALVRTYLSDLAALGVEPGLDQDAAMRGYQVFAAYGAATALEQHTRESMTRRLSGDERSVLEHRLAHWSGLLRDLSINGLSTDVQALATELSSVIEPTRERAARYVYRPG